MRHPGKTVGYGLLLIPIWFVALFVLSIVFGTEQPIDFLSANIIAAAAMALAAWRFARNIGVQTTREAITISVLWVAIVVVVLLIVGFGNNTLGIIFGNWAVYLTYVGIMAGIFLARTRTSTAVPSNTP